MGISRSEEAHRQAADMVEYINLGMYISQMEDPEDDRSLRLISANPATEQEGEIVIRTRMDRHQVSISMADSGKGMPKEVRKRIFEPFFTTKEMGQGAGLGLSIVYNIISQHKGTIEVLSEPGIGTEFLISLPQKQSANQS